MAKRIGALINKATKLPAREFYLWGEHASLYRNARYPVQASLIRTFSEHGLREDRIEARSPLSRRNLAYDPAAIALS